MKIINCKDLDEAGKMAASFIIKVLIQKPNAVFALPTGKSPLFMYKELVNVSLQKGYDWTNVVTFNLDEYYNLNPKFSNESYRHYMNSIFFDNININKSNTHFPYSEGMSEIEIHNYDALIDSFNGFDVTILGVGVNGHIAFNEPPADLNSETRIVKLSDSTRQSNAIYFDNNIDNVPLYAVTMGIKSILHSKRVILIACGENKRNAIEHLKNATSFDPDWPVTALYNFDDLIVLTDLYNENH